MCYELLDCDRLPPGLNPGAGRSPSSDVVDDRRDPDSGFSESDRADLAWLRERRENSLFWSKLWRYVVGGAKWTVVLAGGVGVLLGTIKVVLGAIRDGL